MEIISRAEAKAAALKRYFTGKPCKHGHIAERVTINGACRECDRLKMHRQYHENREENLRKQKIRRDSNPNHAAEQLARRHRRDPSLAAKMALREQDASARELARSLGQPQYFSPRPCGKGHLGNRFVGDGHCVECNKINCRLRFGFLALRDPSIASAREAANALRAERRRFRDEERARKKEEAKPWHAARAARQTALRKGDKTYIGRQCPAGHPGLRYAIGGGCVECSAIAVASEAKKQYDLAYYGRNRERILIRSRLDHARHPERNKANTRAWVKRNPEKRRAISQAYNARRRQVEKGGDSTLAIFAWKQAAPKICYWCGDKCKKKFHVDHYVALSKGGKHEISNLVIACPTCNLRKNAKDPLEFAASMGRLF